MIAAGLLLLGDEFVFGMMCGTWRNSIVTKEEPYVATSKVHSFLQTSLNVTLVLGPILPFLGNINFIYSNSTIAI